MSCPSSRSPRRPRPRPLATAAVCLSVVAGAGTVRPARAEGPPARAAAPATRVTPASSRHVRLDTVTRVGEGFTAALEGGAHAELTLDPRLQDTTEEVFRSFQLPYAAAVVLSIPDGRVLALAAHSSVSPELGVDELALHPWAPAASVFKVVSAAALLSDGGLTSTSRTCYHGGVSAVL